MVKKSPKIEILNSKHSRSAKISGFLGKFNNKTTLMYSAVFIAVGTLAILGSNPLEKESQVNSIAPTETTSVISQVESKPASVDTVSETNLVANLAESANLSVAPNTASLSVSVSVLQDSSTETSGVVEKPKILEVANENREIKTYKAESEEDIAKVSEKFGITAQTIKWVNNIKGGKLEAGKEIRILPVDGIVYSPKAEDNLEEIAKKYEASLERILSYNNIENNKLEAGKEIVIPGGILPEKERPDYVAPVARRFSASYGVSQSSVSNSAIIASNYNAKAGNAYAWGNCTWYVYNLRPDIGSFWGNASSWAYSARAAGYKVDSTPAVGSIAQWNPYAGGMSGWGHVAYVEAVHADGTITVSEMNTRGLGVTSRRTIPASQVSNFIH
ncbi:MAG: CHAP domain-containing protein [bacterium]|nr:CHAP domain-containing protein [bacterium]